MSDDPGAVAAAYFQAWMDRNWTALRGLQGMAEVLEDIVVQKRFVDGPDVLTWFDLHTSVAPPAPTANWSRVERGGITRIRVTFDARALGPPAS